MLRLEAVGIDAGGDRAGGSARPGRELRLGNLLHQVLKFAQALVHPGLDDLQRFGVGLGYHVGQFLHVGEGLLGLVDAAYVQRVTALIEKAGLPVLGPSLSTTDNAARYLELMQIDKKAQDGEIRFVLLDGMARAFVRGAPEALVREVINACCLRL